MTTLFIFLGIMKTRFNTNNSLRNNIIDNVNDEMDIGIPVLSNENCENINYGDWYSEERYVSTCPTLISKEKAENENLNTYNTCVEVSSNLCGESTSCNKLTIYKRDIVGCS